MGVFGGAGLAWSMANPQFGAEGAPILLLRVTPMHCALMLGVGVLTILASLGRAALVFSRIASFGWLTLMVACIWQATGHQPGPLGFDSRDSLLYGALALYNLALVLWFTIGVERTAKTEDRRPGRPVGEAAQRRPDAVTTR